MANPVRGNRDPRRSLLIRSLRFDTPTSLVRREFERFGAIRDVYLPLDYRSRRPRGFGFVEYVEEEDAKAALEKMDGAILDGVPINVTFAQEGRKSPESMRHREYESFHGGGGRRVSSHRYGSHHHYKSDPYRRYPSPKDYREGSRSYGNRHSSYFSRSRSPPPSRGYERHKMQHNHHRNEDRRRVDDPRSHNIRGRSSSNGNEGNYRSEVYERNHPQRDSARSYSRGRSRSRSRSRSRNRSRSRSRSMSEYGSRDASCSVSRNRSTSLNQSPCGSPERGRNNNRKIEFFRKESESNHKGFLNEHPGKNHEWYDSDQQMSINKEQQKLDIQTYKESPTPGK
ncbi:RRM domain-containing protein SC35-like splicing factor [Cryptosporidium ubiquitum]|uniref:RRM domain-containing protein SC35-like splicing factor n=1 Tax=Cryptosporidium ubiquitum TaxID=857276 RepID=A0A1J4MG49_9CRYT|nr:RRM domain-containing protein SC35-like splicing factor [Cryptosporidium ubiquitum]OII73168.1 RRM domain-containing protein SC35-like splicing factor [Cryptosporidium ubiquitum]